MEGTVPLEADDPEYQTPPPVLPDLVEQPEEKVSVQVPKVNHAASQVANLKPTTQEQRTWGIWNITTLWIGMAINIPSYLAGASLIQSGLNWWQALLAVFFGNVIVFIPLALNGDPGVR